MQLKNLLSFLRRNFWDLLLVSILLGTAILVANRNYTPGTWLLGWDDLVPELNFKLNIGRSLSAVWQEYQGLGLLGGMSHAADLPRQLFLLLSSLVLPLSFLRYFWTFLMLITGPLGVYYLVKRLVGPVGSSSHPTSSTIAAGARWDSLRFRHPLTVFAPFSASIYYLFNLATLQTFFTPFETFTGFYGFLPWLLFFALNYLQNGKRSSLLLFAIVSLLATPAFYVQTLFIVYAIFLMVFALETILKFGKSGILRSIKLSFVTFAINSFWLLPVIYFTITSGQIPGNSHINSIATLETVIMNQARSDFRSVATLKGYWFDYFDWSKEGKYELLYKDWIGYTSNSNVEKASIVLFWASVAGFMIGIFNKKTKYAVSFLILGAVAFAMLSGKLPQGIPVLSEAFRNAFTKWGSAMSLIYAIGLGLLVFTLADFFKRKIELAVSIILTSTVIFLSIYCALPESQGKLIADSMKVNLPGYYQDATAYFKNIDPSKRIALMPLTDFWGWQFNDWASPADRQGYRGSGFIWYGIPQPILSRTFDVWSPLNENFYNEFNYALFYGGAGELGRVLAKYQVNYILFDDSIIQSGDPSWQSQLQKQKDVLENINWITKDKEIGKITVYKVNNTNVTNFISAPVFDFGEGLFTFKNSSESGVVETFPDSQGYPEAKNCELKQKGSVTKSKKDGGNFYQAFDGGVSCDYFYYPTLDNSKAYSLHISGKNLTGRSLKFYLYNVAAKRADMVELLPTGDFDKTYIIYPSPADQENGRGYTLNVETRSFGKVASENLLNKIEFLPLEFEINNYFPAINNDLTINSVKKYGTWAYKVEVEHDGLLQLGQGYDKGWVAFSLNGFKATIFPHTKFNGWSNGYLVGVGQGQSELVRAGNQNTNGVTDQLQPSLTVFIVYWPQLLEWGGVVLGLLTIVFLINFPKRVR